jgi:glycosyltransferase involved in cell wall biosynthesis
LTVFCPAPKETARKELGFSRDAQIILFTANGVRRNIFKDYQTMRAAIALVAEKSKRPIFFVAVGDNGGAERIAGAELIFVPYQKDPRLVARYYQAADIYLHGAKADTFPNTVLEALACGTPVVATAVGGIPEQINGMNVPGSRTQGLGANCHRVEDATGILTTPGNAEEIALAIEHLLADSSLRIRLGKNAAKDAAQRFDLRREARDYLDWYEEILGDFELPKRVSNGRRQ